MSLMLYMPHMPHLPLMSLMPQAAGVVDTNQDFLHAADAIHATLAVHAAMHYDVRLLRNGTLCLRSVSKSPPF